MTAEEIIAGLSERLGGRALEPDAEAPVSPESIFVDASRLSDACLALRDDPALRFECLLSITGTDMPAAGKIHVAYLLLSLTLKRRFILKVRVDRNEPSVPSVTSIWPAAEWHEREVFDLLGVKFSGHGALSRLLLPDDWVGHPLLKDYKEEEVYHGMPTVRPPSGL
jgi:NADH-quinone oxidoreductase subunit C